MQMCVHEGEFLPAVYDALCTRYQWAEAQRIRTAVCILEDNRAAYGAWYKNNHERVDKLEARAAKKSSARDGELSIDDYQRELTENRQGLANANAALAAHKTALLQGLGSEGGLLDPEEVEFVQEISDVHTGKIELLESAIADYLGMPDASLDDE